MLYVIHVVRRPISILDALGVFFVRTASVLGRSLENKMATRYKCRRLTSRMMARASTLELAGIVLSFPKTGGKQKTENCQ